MQFKSERAIMPIKQIGSPDPRYLAATDILIGDMSDINYEFLLFDRPIILLANEWLRENFPDIGIKTDLESIQRAIERSITKPEEYAQTRKYWLNKIMYKPDGDSSNRVIDTIILYSKIEKPFILLIHGTDEVLKVHLDPLYEVIKKRNIEVTYVIFLNNNQYGNKDNLICVSAHNRLLNDVPCGYKVHIDHGVKGRGVTDFEKQLIQYKQMDYFPMVDLHITEGEVSYEKTKKLLGPYSERAVMVGYPKSDTLLKLNTRENKISVCKELGFDPDKLLITYAPAGRYSYPFKQGASLSPEVIKRLKDISKHADYNLLIKLKQAQLSVPSQIVRKLISVIHKVKQINH